MEMANGRDLFYGVVRPSSYPIRTAFPLSFSHSQVQHYAGNEPRGYSEADTVKVRACVPPSIGTAFRFSISPLYSSLRIPLLSFCRS